MRKQALINQGKMSTALWGYGWRIEENNFNLSVFRRQTIQSSIFSQTITPLNKKATNDAEKGRDF